MCSIFFFLLFKAYVGDRKQYIHACPHESCPVKGENTQILREDLLKE